MRPLPLALVLLCGCTPAAITYRDLVLPAFDSRADSLAAAEVAREVALVRYALDHAYGGIGFVPAERWALMGKRLEAARKARDATQLCTALGDALAELPDAHLSVRLGHDRGTPRCGHAAPLRSGQVGPAYTAPRSRSPFTMEFLTTGAATFGVLALSRLPAHEDASWQGFDDALGALTDSHGILIDLRGNHGGDDTRGRELARLLLDAPPRTASIAVQTRQTPEAITLRLNGLERERRVGLTGLAGRARALDLERDHALSPNAPPWIVETPAAPSQPGDKAYPGPIAILVDAECASSCETTLQALRAHPRARVFGERTAGFVEFGELGLLVLPHSGIEVLLSTKHWEQPAGVTSEKVGIAPDVATAPGRDGFGAAMAWLRAEVPASKIVTAADFTVPEPQRARETERLRALGLRVPDEGIVLAHPYAQPLSRRSYVVPQGWLFRKVPQVVFAPALRADLEVLRTAMERAYGGWQPAEQHGWRWATWFQDWTARLDAAGDRWLPVREAFDPVRGLQQRQLDNHTNVPIGVRFGGGSRVARLAEPPPGACSEVEDRRGEVRELAVADPATQPRRAQRWDGTSMTEIFYVAYPSTVEAPVALFCAAHRIALEPIELTPERALFEQVRRLSGQAFDRPWLRHLSETVAYVRLPTFSKSNGELYRRDRDKWEQRTGAESALVVDLRGNDGGDALFDAVRGWVDGTELTELLRTDRQHAGSCLYPALRWGYAALSSYGLKAPLSAELLRGLQSGLDPLFHRDDPACRATLVEERAHQHYGTRSTTPRRGKPRIIVLVDSGCGSDCELMAQTLGKLPEATVVGQNTFGVAGFIQPGYSVLPNTRLPFRIALGTADAYGDGRSFDGYGLDVDVVLDGASAATDEGLTRLVEVLLR